jgi:Tfp pilus assembly protein PilO
MDQFDALPLPHKVLLVFLALASIAGVFYFVLIGELETEIAQSQASVRKTEQAAAQLKRFENKDLMAALEAELAELREHLAANKALLPEDEMIPSLITSIKRQADELGLKIVSFQKLERFSEDYVDVIPVLMEVEGSFPVVVSFFDALAQPGMRTMTVTDLSFKAVNVKDLLNDSVGIPVIGGLARSSSIAKSKKDTGPLSPVQELILRLDEYERAVNRMRVKANFKVNAYSYTGELLSDEERGKRGRSKKRKRGRH